MLQPPRRLVVAVIVALTTGCAGGGSAQPAEDGKYQLPTDQREEATTAYLAEVVADPPGDDIAPGGGEHVVLRSAAEIRIDMGGWRVEDADGHRLDLGIGRQIDVGAALRLYSSCGEDSADTVFACAGREVLDDEGDTLRLLDAAGAEIARFQYGDASGSS